MLSAWLLVVAVGSALVWTVISRAGDELAAAASPPFQASAPSPTEAEVATPSSQAPQDTRKPTVIRSKAPSPTANDSSTSSIPESVDETPLPPSSPPAPSEQPANHSDDDDHDWDDGDKWDDDGENSPVVRATWQGSGGVVTAECQGWAISLLSAQGDSGYHVEVWSKGPRRVGVNFEAQDGSGQRTEVFGACYRGTPKFYARDGSESDGDDVNE